MDLAVVKLAQRMYDDDDSDENDEKAFSLEIPNTTYLESDFYPKKSFVYVPGTSWYNKQRLGMHFLATELDRRCRGAKELLQEKPFSCVLGVDNIIIEYFRPSARVRQGLFRVLRSWSICSGHRADQWQRMETALVSLEEDVANEVLWRQSYKLLKRAVERDQTGGAVDPWIQNKKPRY